MKNETSISGASPDDTIRNGGDALVGRAKDIPIGPATPFMSISPIAIPSPGRPVELKVRVSAPTTGSQLPVILLSHGGGFTNYISSF